MNTIDKIIKPIKSCISRFKKLNIIVFGDTIFDIYLRGEVKRISPEAPVPILNTRHNEYRLGGGGNVACNLANMGINVILCSVIGKDKNGIQLLDFLKKSNLDASNLVITSKRKTSVKTRVIAQNQQIIRIDDEDTHVLEDDIIKKMITKIKNMSVPIDGILISDYGKGVVNNRSFQSLVEYAHSRNIFVSLDPKQRNFDFYKHIDVMTPNHFEAAEAIGESCETLAEVKAVGVKIITKHKLKQLIITRGDKGMVLFDNESDHLSNKNKRKNKRKPMLKIYNLPTFNRSLFDVSGAGDTVIALYTAAYLSSKNHYLAALIANISAGIVVSHFGTSPVTLEDFNSEISNKILLKKIIKGKQYE